MALAGLGFAISGVCNLLNGKLQRDFQREQNELNRELNRQEREADRLDKRAIDREHIRRDDDRYIEKAMWPLVIPAMQLNRNSAEYKQHRRPHVLVIVAKTEIAVAQKKVVDEVWDGIARYLNRIFPSNGKASVSFIWGAYKDGFKAQDGDVETIYSLIPNIPTIFIAPHTTSSSDSLTFLVAAWGEGISSTGPMKDRLDVDFRTLYIESIRTVTLRLRADNAERDAIKRNRKIFEQEKILKDSVLSTSRPDAAAIDQQYPLYDGLTATNDAYIEMSHRVEDVFKLFLAVIADSYFVCVCGMHPTLPKIINDENLQVGDSKFKTLVGYYSMLLSASYSRGIANVDKEAALLLSDLLRDAQLFEESRMIGELHSVCLENEAVQSRMLSAAQKKFAEGEYEQAYFKMQLIADKNPKAMCNMGVMLKNGLGCRKSVEQAKRCFNEAAKHGFYPAYLELATVYEDLCADDKAEQMLLQAAKADVQEASYRLGVFYIKRKRSNEAMKWFTKAAKNGHKEAKDILEEMNSSARRPSPQWLSGFNRSIESVVDAVCDVGGGIIAYLCRKLHISMPPYVTKIAFLTYDDLEKFALERKKDYPEVSAMYLALIHNKIGVEVLQLMLSDDGPVKRGENNIGRRILAQQIDGKILALMSEKEVAEHVIPV